MSRNPYSMNLDITLRGLTLREAVDVIAVTLESLPPEHAGRSFHPYLRVERSDEGRGGTDAGRRFTVDMQDASVVIVGNALARLRQTIDGYQSGESGDEVSR